MDNLKIFCLCIHDELLQKVKRLNYLPVALGKDNYQNGWIRDNTGENISYKNKYYGEYTFHYWLWKNKMETFNENDWVGFCAYRRFWLNEKEISNSELPFKDKTLREVPEVWNNYDVILGQNIYMDGWSKMKIIKHGLRSFILNPKYLLKKNQNLKLHFDSFHGHGNLDKAIEVLDSNDKQDFKIFMENQNFYNRGNMFIIKNKDILKNFYNTIFPWLIRCENIFGFKSNDYGSTRIYGFLMERFISYWFNKYTKVKTWPIAFYNINKEELI